MNIINESIYKCYMCKEYKTEKEFYKNRSNSNGLESCCKECSRIKDRKYRETHPEKIKSYRERNLIRSYRFSDKKKGFKCDLTVEWLKHNITSKPCIYCNSTIQIGCDRINNSIGHTIDNVIPCCKVCNFIRSNQLSHEEMLILKPGLIKIMSLRNNVSNEESSGPIGKLPQTFHVRTNIPLFRPVWVGSLTHVGFFIGGN